MTGDRLRQAADALNQGVARRVEGGQATAFQAVLSAAARGDEDAFGALWHGVQPALLYYLKVIAPDAAEDLASQTWLQVVRGLGRFRGEESAFRAWVFTIARHEVLNWRRPAAGRATETTADQRTSSPTPPTAARTAAALIATLPPDQAEVVTLRIIGGLDVAEVAAVTGKQPSTVRVLSHQALQRLSDRLGATSTTEPETPRTRSVPVEQVQQPARRVEGEEATAFQATLSAAARGDEDAFGKLWRDLQPRLLRYFMVAAPAAAEDLTSETWLAVVRGIDRFRGNKPAFRAWVFTIARHEVLNWRRRAARRATETTAEQTTPASTLPAAAALIDTLPPDQADVVTLRIIGGLDVAEVAKITGKRPGTVRALSHQALQRLGKQANPAGGGGRRDHGLTETAASIGDHVTAGEAKAQERCPYCEYFFDSPEELRQHLLHLHREDEPVVKARPPQEDEPVVRARPQRRDTPYPTREGEPCPYCAHVATNPDELRQHLLHLHPEVEPEPDWWDLDGTAALMRWSKEW